MLPFTMAELSEAVHNGEVTARSHPTLPYTIYNYSPAVQYSNRWNEVTLTCRGLILDFEGNIIARPWKKFFNLGQVDLPIQMTDPVEVMDKADGSLGILYPTDTGYAISTRGSMTSEQAIHATQLWQEKYSHLRPLRGYTLLFEIVYPKNRVVLNYGGMDDIILLGAVSNESGHYWGPGVARYLFRTATGREADWTGPVVEVMPFDTISDALGHMARDNAEGYVIRSGNFMVKLKQPDYLELHRLVSNMTPKTIWEQLKGGKSIEQICANLPDEFHSMAESFAVPMMEAYAWKVDDILAGYEKTKRAVDINYPEPTRKDYAKAFTRSAYAKYYFSLLDGRTITSLVWDSLRPKEAVITSQED